ncbi:MAG: bacillithiol biosynthesis BshC [Bacteroidetes bacterium]|nr:bacillithiol biosynthesis BshC [Bacteroidota bacterium]
MEKLSCSSDNLSSAIRKWTNHFLGNYGLLILDANDASLKRKFAGIMEKELLGQESFKLVNQTKVELSAQFLPSKSREKLIFFTSMEIQETESSHRRMDLKC